MSLTGQQQSEGGISTSRAQQGVGSTRWVELGGLSGVVSECRSSDSGAFKRCQNFGLVAKEFCAIGNNLSSNDVKVSDLPHSQI